MQTRTRIRTSSLTRIRNPHWFKPTCCTCHRGVKGCINEEAGDGTAVRVSMGDMNQDHSPVCLNRVGNRGTQATIFSAEDTLGQQQTCSGPDVRRPRSTDTKCDYRHADASPSPSLTTKASRNIYRHLATHPPRQTLLCPRRLCYASRSKSLRPLRLAIFMVMASNLRGPVMVRSFSTHALTAGGTTAAVVRCALVINVSF